MKNCLKFLNEMLDEVFDMLIKEILVPIIVITAVNHYFGTVATIVAIILSSSIWSAWLTILDAPGESLKWKLKWFKQPPSDYIVYVTAKRAGRISWLTTISLILSKVF